MILLKTPADLDAQPAEAIPRPAREALRRRMAAWLRELRRFDPGALPDPKRDGCFACLEPGETAIQLPGWSAPRPIAELPFEAVEHDAQARAFFAHYVPSNSFALTLCAPDDASLDAAVRAALVEQIEPASRPEAASRKESVR